MRSLRRLFSHEAEISPGYTWALSDAAVPATLLATEATQAAQWRLIYLKGFYVRKTPLDLIPN